MWGSKIFKFQWREVENSSTFNMREGAGSFRAALYRLSAGQAPLDLGKHACLSLKTSAARSAIFFQELKCELAQEVFAL